MHDQPSVPELIEAVKAFIDETAAPNLKGHAAFHARVASNALATVLRDLELRPGAESEERAGLIKLLQANDTQSTDELNRELSAQIRSGQMSLSTPGLIEYLKRTTMAQVEIDQPRYSGMKTAKR